MTFRTLDLNLLKVFEALMTEGSVTRAANALFMTCLLYTSPSPRDRQKSRMPSSA